MQLNGEFRVSMPEKNGKREVEWVVFIYMMSVLIRVYFNLAHYEIYTFYDELIHEKLAASIYKNASMQFRGLPQIKQDFLYYLLIGFAYEIADGIYARQIVVIINALVMSSSVFVVYALGKELLRLPVDRILACLLVVCMPEMCYSGSVLQENLYFPVFLLAVYTYYIAIKKWNTQEDAHKNFIVNGVVVGLLCMTKDSGYILFAAEILTAILLCIREKKRADLIRYTATMIFCYALCLLILLAVAKGLMNPQNSYLLESARIYGPEKNVVETTFIENLQNHKIRILSNIGSYLVYSILITGVFPFLFMICAKGEKKPEKALILITSTAFFCAILVISITDYYSEGVLRIHYRYLFCFSVIFWLFFLRRMEWFHLSKKWFGVAAFCYGVLQLFVPFIPVAYMNRYDSISARALSIIYRDSTYFIFKLLQLIILFAVVWMVYFLDRRKGNERKYNIFHLTEVKKNRRCSRIFLSMMKISVCGLLVSMNLFSNIKQYQQIDTEYKQPVSAEIEDAKKCDEYLRNLGKTTLIVGEDKTACAIFECYFLQDYVYTTTESFWECYQKNQGKDKKLQNIVQVSRWYEVDTENLAFVISKAPLEMDGLIELKLGLTQYHLYSYVL